MGTGGGVPTFGPANMPFPTHTARRTNRTTFQLPPPPPPLTHQRCNQTAVHWQKGVNWFRHLAGEGKTNDGPNVRHKDLALPRGGGIHCHPETVSPKSVSTNDSFNQKNGRVETSKGGLAYWGPEGWGRTVGPQRVGPRNFAFLITLPSRVRLFSLSKNLLVELWPRVVAMDHPNCAFGLFWGHFVSWVVHGTIRGHNSTRRLPPEEGSPGGEGSGVREKAVWGKELQGKEV